MKNGNELVHQDLWNKASKSMIEVRAISRVLSSILGSNPDVYANGAPVKEDGEILTGIVGDECFHFQVLLGMMADISEGAEIAMSQLEDHERNRTCSVADKAKETA